MTGGDKIAARFVRRDFFEFAPQFKLLISGNHKTSFRGVDEAIRRRFLLLPFSVTVPEAERDPELPEKLKADWPGILAWMIAGCLDWQERGLRPPAAVLEATGTYLEAEGAFQLWLLPGNRQPSCSHPGQAGPRPRERRWATRSASWRLSRLLFLQRIEAVTRRTRPDPDPKLVTAAAPVDMDAM
jgi:putative DNA primase/helicase